MSFLPIDKDYPLILASASSRRKRLLQQIGLPFRSVPSDTKEEQARGKLPVTARLLAEQKAIAVHKKTENSWILGADTMVVLGEIILGKPGDHGEARSMLFLLNGKEHKVTTGFSLLDPSGIIAHTESVTTFVKMKVLKRKEIESYVKTGESFGKAGGYAIQGIGSFMVESISGPYTNVVGLPLCALVKALLATGALKDFPLLP